MDQSKKYKGRGAAHSEPSAAGLRWRPVRVAGVAVLAVAAVAISSCSSSKAANSSSSAGSASGGKLTVGILEVAQVSLFDTIVARFEKQMQADLPGRQLTFKVQNAQGKPALIETIARSFASSNYDMFAVLGSDAIIALNKLEKKKPIIALAMSDPVGAKVATSLEHPGGNVTGSTDFVSPSVLLPQLLKISPQPKRLGTVYDPSEQNMQLWISQMKAAAAAAGVQLVEAPISGPGDIPSATRSLLGRSDAIIVGPDGVVFGGLPAIGQVALSNKLPFYTIGGDVTIKGMLASLGPDYAAVGQLAGQVAAKIVKGASPADIGFAQPQGVQVQVNPQTEQAIGVTVPASLTAKPSN
jgi:putative tryptophan/tyrosine transport system substrate-binding protein